MFNALRTHAIRARSTGAIALSIFLTLIVLSGCASTSVKVTALSPSAKGSNEFDLAGIELESIYSYTQSRAELEAVIVSSARNRGISIHEREAESKRNAISFFIREQSYTKGFKTLLSLAIIADIRDPAGSAVMRAEWFHDGDESFDSFLVLASALDETFGKLSTAMRKAE
jgi:hypothetical protein